MNKFQIDRQDQLIYSILYFLNVENLDS